MLYPQTGVLLFLSRIYPEFLGFWRCTIRPPDTHRQSRYTFPMTTSYQFPHAVSAPAPAQNPTWHCRDPFTEQRAAQHNGALVDFRHLAVLSISGEDSPSWLHSLLSQKVLDMPAILIRGCWARSVWLRMPVRRAPLCAVTIRVSRCTCRRLLVIEECDGFGWTAASTPRNRR